MQKKYSYGPYRLTPAYNYVKIDEWRSDSPIELAWRCCANQFLGSRIINAWLSIKWNFDHTIRESESVYAKCFNIAALLLFPAWNFLLHMTVRKKITYAKSTICTPPMLNEWGESALFLHYKFPARSALLFYVILFYYFI